MSTPSEKRISGQGKAAYHRLSLQDQRRIVEFLEENPNEWILSPKDLVNAYLIWEGIMGYTDAIINLVLKSYDADIRELK